MHMYRRQKKHKSRYRYNIIRLVECGGFIGTAFAVRFSVKQCLQRTGACRRIVRLPCVIELSISCTIFLLVG